jgi:hypothetical protein
LKIFQVLVRFFVLGVEGQDALHALQGKFWLVHGKRWVQPALLVSRILLEGGLEDLAGAGTLTGHECLNASFNQVLCVLHGPPR